MKRQVAGCGSRFSERTGYSRAQEAAQLTIRDKLLTISLRMHDTPAKPRE
jgi:hypothetical protein